MRRFLILAALAAVFVVTGLAVMAAPQSAGWPVAGCTADAWLVRLPYAPEFQRREGGPTLWDVYLYFGLDTDSDEMCDGDQEDGWSLVDQGHWTVVVDSATVQSWETGAEVFQYFAQMALDSGVVDAYLAKAHVLELTGGSWAEDGYFKEFSYP